MYKQGRRGENNLLKAERQEHTGPTVGCLKHLERLGRGREQLCLVCSASFRSCADVVCSDWICEVWGCGPSDVWAIGFSDWRVGMLCAHWFSTHSVPSFPVALQYRHETSCYVHSGWINCVHLVMPRCMFNMQLFLSEIVKFHFDRK